MRDKVIKGTFWSAMQNWGRQIIALVVFVILSRLVAPSAFGLVALGTTFTAFAQIFLDQGFAESIIQTSNLTDSKLNTAFWTNILFGFLLTALVLLFSEPVALFFEEPDLALVIVYLSPIFLLASLRGVQEAILRRNLQFKILALRSFVGTIAGGCIGIVMAFSGFGVWALVGQIAGDQLMSTLTIWYSTDWRPKWEFSREDFRELFSFGMNVLGFRLVNFVNRRSDDLLIGYFLGTELLGYYTVAYRILRTLTNAFLGVLNAITLPTFSRIQDDHKRIGKALQDVAKFASLMTLPVFIGLFIVAADVILVFYGEVWAPSIPVARVLSLMGIIHTVTYFNSPIWVAKGKPDWRFKFTVVNAVGNLVAFVIAVPFGITAVAIGYVIRGWLFLPLPVYLTKRLIDISYKDFLVSFIPAGFATAIMTFVLVFCNYIIFDSLLPYTRLLLNIGIGGGVYVGTIALAFPDLRQRIYNLAMPFLSKLGNYRSKTSNM